jgi:hypothetical protein
MVIDEAVTPTASYNWTCGRFHDAHSLFGRRKVIALLFQFDTDGLGFELLAVLNRASQTHGVPARSANSRYHSARFRNSTESGIILSRFRGQ